MNNFDKVKVKMNLFGKNLDDEELGEEMNVLDLEDDEKELIRKGEADVTSFEDDLEADDIEEDDYYGEDE